MAALNTISTTTTKTSVRRGAHEVQRLWVTIGRDAVQRRIYLAPSVNLDGQGGGRLGVGTDLLRYSATVRRGRRVASSSSVRAYRVPRRWYHDVVGLLARPHRVSTADCVTRSPKVCTVGVDVILGRQ